MDETFERTEKSMEYFKSRHSANEERAPVTGVRRRLWRRSSGEFAQHSFASSPSFFRGIHDFSAVTQRNRAGQFFRHFPSRQPQEGSSLLPTGWGASRAQSVRTSAS